MNEHAGLGSLLSVLIVVGFTLILHEAERSARVANGPPTIVAQAEPIRTTPPPPADHHAAITAPPPALNDLPPISPPIAQLVRVDPITLKSATSRVVGPLSRSKSSIQTVSARSPTSRPATPPPSASPRPVSTSDAVRSTVTVAQPGERLLDVAIRIYGSAEAVEKLWRANRDRLASRDALLNEGWLLRTP